MKAAQLSNLILLKKKSEHKLMMRPAKRAFFKLVILGDPTRFGRVR